jgi:hypothetical protein
MEFDECYILLKQETECKYLEPNSDNEDDDVYFDVWKPAAIFSNYELAEEYVEKSRLKTTGIYGKYRQTSLLASAKGHEIKLLDRYLPVNPEL